MIVKLVALVLPLGLDTFAVAAAIGAAGVAPRRRLRVSLLMAGFEAGMPLVGLALGAPLGRAIGSTADYLAIAVLLAFGIYTLRAEDEAGELAAFAAASGWQAVALGLSVSVDEFAIGFTLGLLGVPALVAIPLIGVQALIVSQLGLRLGGTVAAGLRDRAERFAGLALIALGLGLLAEQLAPR